MCAVLSITVCEVNLQSAYICACVCITTVVDVLINAAFHNHNDQKVN